MNAIGGADLHPSPPNLYDLGQPGLGISVVNWMSPQNPQVVDWDTQLADFTVSNDGVGMGQGGFPFFLTSTNTMEANAWSTDAIGASSSLQVSAHNGQPNQEGAEFASTHSVATASTDGKYYVDGAGARAPFGGRSNTRRSAVNIDPMHEKDGTADISRSAMASPTELVPDSAYENFRESIRTEALHLVDVDSDSFPSHAHLELFVRYYFDKFHPVFPFLRKASFPNDSQDWVLLLAVAVVGSRYLRRIHGSQPGEILQQILQKALGRLLYGANLSDDDTPYLPGDSSTTPASPSIYTLKAGILNTICMLHSGKKSQVERAFLDRHYLMEACHSSRLLSAVSPTMSFTDQSDKEEAISAFLKRESEVRTGMMIWVRSFIDLKR